MTDLDALIDQVMAESELSSGASMELVLARNPNAQIGADISYISQEGQSLPWTDAEDAFLEEHYGYYTDAEIGMRLGRSETAVKLRRQRALGICGIARHDDFVTAQEIGRMLGIDSHSAILLLERGLIGPHWRFGVRQMWVVRRVSVYRWAVNPYNWCYIQPQIRETSRIGDAHLRRLIERQQRRWGDEWWTPSEVADYHGVGHTDVNRYIRRGLINSVKWGNHWILRSEALKPGLRFFSKKGGAKAQEFNWNEECEAFLIIGKALGVNQHTLARMVKMPHKKVEHHLRQLRVSGEAQYLIDKFGLEVSYDPNAPTNQMLSAEWERYGYLFRRVGRGR